MNRALKILLPIVVLAAGLMAAAFLVKSRPAPERQETPPSFPLIRVVEARPDSLALTVTSQGTVSARTASALIAEVPGKLVSVSPALAVGGAFRRGQVLAQIDRRDYELAVEQARAQIAQAETALALERAESEVAISEWNELGEGDAPPLVRRAPQLAQAEATVAAAKAALASAELSLRRTTLVAPFEGRVRAKLADLGQYVGPGTPVAELFSTDFAEITLPVPLDELAFLDVDGGVEGSKVLLRGRLGGGERTWQGTIVRSAGEIDPRTRMLSLIARVPRPDRPVEGGLPLTMGLFVEAEIQGPTRDDLVALPRTALRPGDTVLVVEETGDEARLRRRPVEVFRRLEDTVLLTSGLADGERVCISPLETPVDGMRVRLSGLGDSPNGDSEPTPEAAR